MWAVIAAAGVVTYGSRLCFVALFARRQMPWVIQQALRFVPAAVLAALVAPGLLLSPSGALDLSLGNARMIAAAAAGAVAFRTRSTSATVVCGMATLWLVQALR